MTPIKWQRVDFPEPEGPQIATNSPESIVKSTPRSASICVSPSR